MSDRPKTEPSADMRQAASATWQLYVALQDEGFTPAEAMQIVSIALSSAVGGGGQT